MDTGTVRKPGTGNEEFPAEKFQILDERIKEYKGKTGATIRVMSKAQEIFGYLPREVMFRIADGLGIPPVKVYGIATFYSYFSTMPPARHKIISCQGTACYVSGGRQMLEKLERILGIRRGETTPDREFSIHPVRCIGTCALAPVIKIDSEIYSRVSIGKIKKILARYSKKYEEKN
ncbi:MAG: NAD(P)H-dependent oxidoreductase subunit E [Desulfobulbaceae bacterium]|nr:NAD(P)H-dependent oxidoreductase subunit E [Desulfobulbaceae bacterium]MCK5322876.1 NAD(P)H-dependent oxidoreductase subunit E [Desulfobulbaceae bacterium]MCK5437102.1 NAD(P)H-dependent oxidoreductase subunit E [Desulfobulbaceae bacterium]